MHVKPALAVGVAVGAVEPPDYALATGVVPSVLAAGRAMQVEVDAEPVLACVLDAPEEIAPRDLRDVLVA